MPNHKSSGSRRRLSDEDRKSWRPADQEDRSRTTERSGQGQSGYGAGRRGEDPSQHYQNRNQSYPRGSDERPAGRPGMGLDDRFTGRGGDDWSQRPDEESDEESAEESAEQADAQPDRAGQRRGLEHE